MTKSALQIARAAYQPKLPKKVLPVIPILRTTGSIVPGA